MAVRSVTAEGVLLCIPRSRVCVFMTAVGAVDHTLHVDYITEFGAVDHTLHVDYITEFGAVDHTLHVDYMTEVGTAYHTSHIDYAPQKLTTNNKIPVLVTKIHLVNNIFCGNKFD